LLIFVSWSICFCMAPILAAFVLTSSLMDSSSSFFLLSKFWMNSQQMQVCREVHKLVSYHVPTPKWDGQNNQTIAYIILFLPTLYYFMNFSFNI
jgi:hypothetical protein